ncbi:MAG: SAM-dependent methyltransferase, partial [Pseudohongiellaceae bacterium]
MDRDPKSHFTEDNKSALEARHEAQKLAFGAMAFQASRCLRDLGLLELVAAAGNQGISLAELQEASPVSNYGVRVLMEASTGTGICTLTDDRFYLTKTGHFILRDPMTIANFDFAHNVNYLGFYHLQEAIESGKPAGLKVFGDWDTIYSGLSSLPQPALESWLRFDHYYSDASYEE